MSPITAGIPKLLGKNTVYKFIGIQQLVYFDVTFTTTTAIIPIKAFKNNTLKNSPLFPAKNKIINSLKIIKDKTMHLKISTISPF